MLTTFWDAKTARVLFTALVFLLVLGFLRGAHGTITLFLFAVFFAYLVDPVVSLLQRLLHGRLRAIAAFYVLFVIVLFSLGYFLGPRVVHEGQSLISGLPALVDRLSSGQFILTVGHDQGWAQARQIQVQHFFTSHRAQILAYAEGFVGQLEAPLTHIWWLILIPILSVFFLKDGAVMAREIVGFGSDRQERCTLQHVIADVHDMLGGYIRAQLILAVLTGVVLTIVLSLMRVPYSFILSPLAGLCEFVPVVGPALACTAIWSIALVLGYNHLLWIFLFLGTWRIIQDYLNAPRIMGRTLGVSPLGEIFAVLAGGEIGGVIGTLAAVPIFAILTILWHRLRVEPTIGMAQPSGSSSASLVPLPQAAGRETATAHTERTSVETSGRAPGKTHGGAYQGDV